MANVLSTQVAYVANLDGVTADGSSPFSNFHGSGTINLGDVTFTIFDVEDIGGQWFVQVHATGAGMFATGVLNPDHYFAQLTVLGIQVVFEFSFHGLNDWQGLYSYGPSYPYADANVGAVNISQTDFDAQDPFMLIPYADLQDGNIKLDIRARFEFSVNSTSFTPSVTFSQNGYLEYDLSGPSTTITIPAGTYHAGTQAAADALARKDFQDQLNTFCAANCPADTACPTQTP